MLAGAVVLVSAAIAGPGAMAQSGPASEMFVPAPRAQPAPQPPKASQPQQARQPAAPQALSGCVRIDVQVGRLDTNGEIWDPFPGNVSLPDLAVYDRSTRRKLFECTDSLTCSGTVNASGSTLRLNIVDEDFDAPDRVGSGDCSLARSSCVVGIARLRLTRC